MTYKDDMHLKMILCHGWFKITILKRRPESMQHADCAKPYVFIFTSLNLGLRNDSVIWLGQDWCG